MSSNKLGKIVVLFSSPGGSTDFLRGLRYVSAWVDSRGGRETAVFFLQDATLAAKSGAGHLPPEFSPKRGIRLYALEEDLSLRGIGSEEVRQDVSVVSYEQLMDEIEAADRVIGCL